MKRINIETIENAREIIREFDRENLREVILFRGKSEYHPHEKTLRWFKFTGLANRDYVDFGCYLPEFDIEKKCPTCGFTGFIHADGECEK